MENPIPGILKLIDYGASGIGSVAGPLLTPWRARSQAKARLIDAQAEADSLKILAEGRATALQIISNAQAEARSSRGLVCSWRLLQTRTRIPGDVKLGISWVAGYFGLPPTVAKERGVPSVATCAVP